MIAEAIKLDLFLGKIVGHTAPLYPFMFHENEDINSVPAPLSNRRYMTSTQAKLISHGNDDLAHEPWGHDKQFLDPYNKAAKEYVQLNSESSSDSDSDSEDDRSNVQLNWMVDADFSEGDDHVVVREADTGNGVKKSGWNNPLAWTDNGNDDDAVLAQTLARMRMTDNLDTSFVQLKDDDDENDETNIITEE